MTYDLSRGHLRSLGVEGGVNRTAALVLAALATAVIGAVWASILQVDPAGLKSARDVWPPLLIQAFPALAAIIALFLIPLYWMVLRPAGQKDPTLPIFAVFGAGTVAMAAGLVLVSGPRAVMAHDVFKIEDAYVRATQTDIRMFDEQLKKAGVLPLLAANALDDDPLAQARVNIRAYNAEVARRSSAFAARRNKVRVDLARRLGDSPAGRERLLQFDRQAAGSDKVVEKFWSLKREYGRLADGYVEVLRRHPESWVATSSGPRLRYGAWNQDIAENYYAMDRLQRDMGRVFTVFQQKPFIDRSVR